MSLFECVPVHYSNDHAHPFGAPPVEGGRGSPETVGSVGSGSTARSAADPMQIHSSSTAARQRLKGRAARPHKTTKLAPDEHRQAGLLR